jgi:hypothetical protein
MSIYVRLYPYLSIPAHTACYQRIFVPPLNMKIAGMTCS